MNDFDFDPTADDLATVEDDLTLDLSVEDDEDEDESYDPLHDDRYDGEGVPSWSAWA